ncbi:MAG: phosphoribosylformylglycinamidine synthase subunit PurQ, partial [Sedimentibacter sp.]
GIAAAISKMTFGNEIGFKANEYLLDLEELFKANYGDIILEVKENKKLEIIDLIEIGNTTQEKQISINNTVISMDEMKAAWIQPLNNIYPIKKDVLGTIEDYSYTCKNKIKSKVSIARPKVFIPVFPGTNCEYDTKRAFERAGAQAEILVFKNLSSKDVQESIAQMNKIIRQSQIIAFPGGFSAGDEPEGSGKFIAAVFRNELLKDAVMDLLKNRDGLVIGICNGFQALVKLGLLPFGEIVDIKDDYPTLTYNKIARHVSTFTKTKIVSNLSPWLNGCQVGDVHHLPLSHGEGRFVANAQWIKKLKENGQIATQYVDANNEPTYDGLNNPNGSVEAIEGITSLDGRVLGKMGHSERLDEDLYINIPGNKDQLIFESGVKYFK